jgi:hypothetical protein
MKISAYVAGWWYTYPSENMSSSVGMMTFPIYGKIKNVPNHQPNEHIWPSFPQVSDFLWFFWQILGGLSLFFIPGPKLTESLEISLRCF